MLTMISFRVYVVIGFFTSALFFAITEFASEPVAGFFRGMRSDAIRGGLPRAAADFIAEPFILAATDPLVAVAAGVVWPLLLVWLFLLVLLVLFAFLSPLLTQARCLVTDC